MPTLLSFWGETRVPFLFAATASSFFKFPNCCSPRSASNSIIWMQHMPRIDPWKLNCNNLRCSTLTPSRALLMKTFSMPWCFQFIKMSVAIPICRNNQGKDPLIYTCIHIWFSLQEVIWWLIIFYKKIYNQKLINIWCILFTFANFLLYVLLSCSFFMRLQAEVNSLLEFVGFLNNVFCHKLMIALLTI